MLKEREITRDIGGMSLNAVMLMTRCCYFVQRDDNPAAAGCRKRIKTCVKRIFMDTAYRKGRNEGLYAGSDAIQAQAAHAGPLMGQMARGVEGRPYEEKENLPVTPRMQTLIDEMLQFRNDGGWQHLYLQAKTLELLALQCQQLENTANKPRGLRPDEIGKVHQAREALLCDIQHPPSLTALARIAGLNEYKLKTGFKEVFGNTVFGYLKNYRLTLARQLLLGGGKTATEVAYETGYSTLQHFSNEFKKKFGISPGKLGGK